MIAGREEKVLCKRYAILPPYIRTSIFGGAHCEKYSFFAIVGKLRATLNFLWMFLAYSPLNFCTSSFSERLTNLPIVYEPLNTFQGTRSFPFLVNIGLTYAASRVRLSPGIALLLRLSSASFLRLRWFWGRLTAHRTFKTKNLDLENNFTGN